MTTINNTLLILSLSNRVMMILGAVTTIVVLISIICLALDKNKNTK